MRERYVRHQTDEMEVVRRSNMRRDSRVRKKRVRAAAAAARVSLRSHDDASCVWILGSLDAAIRANETSLVLQSCRSFSTSP